MNKPLAVKSERVDDIPLLLAQLERMGVKQLLDKHFVTHGNWKGLSLGWCTEIWLSYILSQGDHRLSYVQDWVEKRQKTLEICTKQSLKGLDFSDAPLRGSGSPDRLEAILRYLSDDEQWQEFESELGSSIGASLRFAKRKDSSRYYNSEWVLRNNRKRTISVGSL